MSEWGIRNECTTLKHESKTMKSSFLFGNAVEFTDNLYEIIDDDYDQVFQGVLSGYPVWTCFESLELKIGSLETEKIIIGSLESEKIIIGTLQVHTGYLTFSVKQTLIMTVTMMNVDSGH